MQYRHDYTCETNDNNGAGMNSKCGNVVILAVKHKSVGLQNTDISMFRKRISLFSDCASKKPLDGPDLEFRFCTVPVRHTARRPCVVARCLPSPVAVTLLLYIVCKSTTYNCTRGTIELQL
jgi:hypothetical protein